MIRTCQKCTGTFEHNRCGGQPKYCDPCRPIIAAEQKRSYFARSYVRSQRQCRYCSTVVYGNAQVCEEHKGRMKAERQKAWRESGRYERETEAPMDVEDCWMNLYRAMVWYCKRDFPCCSCTLDGICIYSHVPGTPEYRGLELVSKSY